VSRKGRSRGICVECNRDMVMYGRGLCTTCYDRAKTAGRLGDYAPLHVDRRGTVADLVDQGHVTPKAIAERLGITRNAAFMALKKLRVEGYGNPTVAPTAPWLIPIPDAPTEVPCVGEVMDYLSSEGRTLVWVGIPNDDNPDVTLRLQVQDEVVRAEAAKRPQVKFVDTWNRFSGREGGWAEFVIDPRDNQAKDVRAEDGFHLNTVGAEILALDIAEVVTADLRTRGAAI